MERGAYDRAGVAPRAATRARARVLLLIAGCALVAAAFAVGRGFQRQEPATDLERGMQRAEERQEALADLARDQRGEFDSHPDADLGHVLLPGVHQRDYDTLQVNTFGMREREYVLPKPAGLTRIVLLGDSFVFGWEVAARDRMGARLETYLTERLEKPAKLEVLHLGVTSWNLRAGCAYVRRQLDVLAPDLVIHITPPNDLDDVPGARGFGGMGRFAPARPFGGDALVHLLFPLEEFGIDVSSLVWSGIGYESSSRFAAARADVVELADLLSRLPQPARYLLVGHWGDRNSALHAHLGRHLDPSAVLYLPTHFREDASTWVAPGDPHWNARGNEQVARILYGVILRRGLLPALALRPWPEAEAEADAFAEEGWQEAQGFTGTELIGSLAAGLDFRRLDENTARQVFTGIDRERLVSPYASFLLGNPHQATRLLVQGRCLDAVSLAGAKVHVHVEDRELTGLALEPGRPIDAAIPIPEELASLPALNVRFEAEDFVYRGRALRHCVAFQLDRLALE